jgi:hypothetical protein
VVKPSTPLYFSYSFSVTLVCAIAKDIMKMPAINTKMVFFIVKNIVAPYRGAGFVK